MGTFCKKLAFNFSSTDNPNWQSIRPNQQLSSNYADDYVNDTVYGFFNFSKIAPRLQDLDGFEGFTPRWTLISRLR